MRTTILKPSENLDEIQDRAAFLRVKLERRNCTASLGKAVQTLKEIEQAAAHVRSCLQAYGLDLDKNI